MGVHREGAEPAASLGGRRRTLPRPSCDWADAHSSFIQLHFTLSRIEDITVLEEEGAVELPDDFDPDLYFGEWFGALGGEPTVVRLLVSFDVAGMEGLASWVRSWGLNVTVLDPPELAEQVAAEARQVAARYETDGECSDTECPDP